MSEHEAFPWTHARLQVRHLTVISPNSVFNHLKIKRGIRLILEGIGEDPDREGLRDTLSGSPANTRRSSPLCSSTPARS